MVKRQALFLEGFSAQGSRVLKSLIEFWRLLYTSPFITKESKNHVERNHL